MPLQEKNRSFVDNLENKRHLPFYGLISAFDNKKIPFDKNLFFNYDPSYLASNEWNRCVKFYLDKTPEGSLDDLSELMADIESSETPNYKKLEDLAIKIVREMYGIPEFVKLTAKLGPVKIENESNGEEDDNLKKPLTEQQKENLFPEIQKRIILNSVIHGAAVHQWVSAFYLGYEDLNELNKDYINFYNNYASLINYFNWMHPMALMEEEVFNSFFGIKKNKAQESAGGPGESMGLTQGYNQVHFDTRTIEAFAINFPVLIHELSKGVIEYLLGKSIPEHLADNELEYLYEQADKYSHEYWHYYMGPTLWRALIESSDVDTTEMPEILSYLSSLEYEELSRLCLKMVFRTEEAKKEFKSIKKQIQNESY